MKFNAIARTMDWRSKRMDIVHRLLYHGDAIREDAPANPADRMRGSWSHNVGDDLSHPLLLTRSGVFVPPIFNPGVALVVREEIYQRVGHFPGLTYAGVRPVKLINYWKEVGDFSFYESTDPIVRRHARRPDMLLEWMPNDTSLFTAFPQCRELVAYNIHVCQDKNNHDKSIHFTMNNDRETRVSFTYSSSLLTAYPLIWGSVFLVRYDLFDVLHDAIDRDHFSIYPIDL